MSSLYSLRRDFQEALLAGSRKKIARLPGPDVLTIIDAPLATLTLDASNCYPAVIRLKSASPVSIKLADGQGDGGRYWVFDQVGTGVGTVEGTTAGGVAVTREGTKFKTAGQNTKMYAMLVGPNTLSFEGGAE